jgi:hypothetical protein
MADSLPRIRSISFLPSSHRQYRRACGHIERSRTIYVLYQTPVRLERLAACAPRRLGEAWAAIDLGDLPNDRTRRTGRAGDDNGFACDWAAHVEQAEIGGEAGQDERRP